MNILDNGSSYMSSMGIDIPSNEFQLLRKSITCFVCHVNIIIHIIFLSHYFLYILLKEKFLSIV
jgi:hypothetical protein